MPIVYVCIAPHGGNLLLPEDAPGPVPECRRAMRRMGEHLRAAKPDVIAIMTPHGEGSEGAVTVGVTEFGTGEIDGIEITSLTDLDLAAAWAYRGTERGVPVLPLTEEMLDGPLPLDWGVTIPLALLSPPPRTLPTVVCCPARDLSVAQLMDWGEALFDAAEDTGRRVAVVASADQGHGHAADGPYGYTPASGLHDRRMKTALESNTLQTIADWPAGYAREALADSYWQTVPLLGLARRVPLTPRVLAYEVDHYFGLLCAEFAIGQPL